MEMSVRYFAFMKSAPFGRSIESAVHMDVSGFLGVYRTTDFAPHPADVWLQRTGLTCRMGSH